VIFLGFGFALVLSWFWIWVPYFFFPFLLFFFFFFCFQRRFLFFIVKTKQELCMRFVFENTNVVSSMVVEEQEHYFTTPITDRF